MTGPDPAVAATRVAVRECLGEFAGAGDRPALVLVACSGGADSLALAAATAFEAPRRGVAAGALVVDHGLQPGSARWRERPRIAAPPSGWTPSRSSRVRVEAGAGPEDAARRARHDAYAAAAARHGASAVLLGHTRDDQAEQVLLGLVRGSGTRSLAGMPPRRDLLRRPFLQVTRAQTEHACAAQGIAALVRPAQRRRPLHAGARPAPPRAAARRARPGGRRRARPHRGSRAGRRRRPRRLRRRARRRRRSDARGAHGTGGAPISRATPRR